MYVDGANHQPLVDEISTTSRHPKAAANSSFGAGHDALYLPDTSHPAHILRDTFERIQAAEASKTTYGPTDHPIRTPEHVAGLFDQLRNSLDPGYHDELAQLQKDVEQGGLPLNADRNDGGVVYRSFIEAYDKVSVNHGGVPDSTVHGLLDTAG